MAQVVGKFSLTVVCKGCDSVVEYKYSEVKREVQDDGFLFLVYSYINCPCCGKKIYVSK